MNEKPQDESTRPLDEIVSTTVRPMTGIELRYFELIAAVAQKFSNETRHQTALRYIQEAEQRTTNGEVCVSVKY